MTTSELGRGALFIPLAKVWFVIASFAINFGLPNLLDPDGVGDYGVVNRLIGLINMVMITGTIQAIAKFVAEDPARSRAMRRWAIRVQLGFGGVISLAIFLLAPALADLFNDPGLAGFFRIVAWIPLLYGVYAVQIGIFNGNRDFLSQAAFDMAYAAMRAVGILGAAALGLGVAGVFGAFAGAAAIIMTVALVVGTRERTMPEQAGHATMGVEPAEVIRFGIPVMALVLVSQWLLSFDLFWVKALLPPETSSLLSGAYFAMLNLALVPYMLVLSINFVVFPLVSRSTFRSDPDRTRTYIRQSLRIAFLLGVVMEVVLFASPESAIGMVYPSKPEYQTYALALRVMAPGYLALCVFGITTAIVNGAGRPTVSFAAGFVTLALQGFLCALTIPRWGLVGAAWASTTAFLFGTAALSGYVVARYRAWIPGFTVVRGTLAASTAALSGYWLSWEGAAFLLEAILCAGIFALVLLATGEVARRDFHQLLAMAGRGA